MQYPAEVKEHGQIIRPLWTMAKMSSCNFQHIQGRPSGYDISHKTVNKKPALNKERVGIY
ncbi:MAG: hypothetical protein CL868_20445 [Cytophagaceae bacterium]|nr:hypothetical protein [Cytophagaceae bacterium]